MSKFLRINDFTDVTTPGLDGHEYRLYFDIGKMDSGVFTPETKHTTTITSSGTLQAVWGLSDTQISDTSATTATSILLSTASRGDTQNLPNIILNTYTAPKIPPTQPQIQPGVILPIPEQEIRESNMPTISFLSTDIAELRDQINALSKSLLGEKLLELPQERAILDVYKPVESSEQFRNRIQSLAGVCIALNKNAMGEYLETKNTNELGSIFLLEELICKFSNQEKAAEICRVLKNINELRKGYPTHGDNTEKFLAAHDYFGISYPVSNHALSWERILGEYFKAMESLRTVLSEFRARISSSETATGKPNP